LISKLFLANVSFCMLGILCPTVGRRGWPPG